MFVGYVDGEIVINPTAKQRETSSLELTVASSSKKVVMIEAGGKEIPEDLMFDAIMKAHEVNKQMVEFIEHVKSEVGKEKFSYPSCEVDHDLYDAVSEYAIEKVRAALDTMIRISVRKDSALFTKMCTLILRKCSRMRTEKLKLPSACTSFRNLL